MSWQKKVAVARKARTKSRATLGIASCTLDGKPVVGLRLGKETTYLDADDVEELTRRLSLALATARDMGGEL